MTSRSHAGTDARPIEVLVIGAGPFGLSLAARLKANDVPHRNLGSSMGFWRNNMPRGMFLRSSWDWHLDPQGVWTIERFLDEHRIGKAAVTPFPIDVYLDYVEWFRQNSLIEPEEVVVARLDRGADGIFSAVAATGEAIAARSVVLALGFSSFADTPTQITELLPGDAVRHTLDASDLQAAPGKRYLIVGGRQSAFEWAALLGEAGAASVDIVHRHPSPAFAEADWTWVSPLMEEMVANPVWFRTLSHADQETFRRRLWGEGRLKVEPWLAPRILNAPVTIRPDTSIVSSHRRAIGIDVVLSDGDTVHIDEVILATGYRPDIGKVDLLRNGSVLSQIDQENGLPKLDAGFQTSVPGLYVTSLLASGDFGPFFGFTVAARGAATILGDELARRLS